MSCAPLFLYTPISLNSLMYLHVVFEIDELTSLVPPEQNDVSKSDSANYVILFPVYISRSVSTDKLLVIGSRGESSHLSQIVIITNYASS